MKLVARIGEKTDWAIKSFNRAFPSVDDQKKIYEFKNLVLVTDQVMKVVNNDHKLLMLGLPVNFPDTRAAGSTNAMLAALSELDGAFAAFYVIPERNNVNVITDFLGFYPLYCRRHQDKLDFSTHTRVFESDADLGSWGAFYSLGSTVGERTLLKGVMRVPAASILSYDLDNLSESRSSTWQWPAKVSKPDIYGIRSAWLKSCEGYAAHADNSELLLSGGFDSRLIALSLEELGLKVNALTIPHADEAGDLDGRIAGCLANRLNLQHRRARSSPDFFESSSYVDYLEAIECSVPSLYLFISQVCQFLEKDAFWDGLIPGITLAAPGETGTGFEGYIRGLRCEKSSPFWRGVEEIFETDVTEAMWRESSALIREECEKYPDNTHGVTEFRIRNKTRNRTSLSALKALSSKSIPLIPGMSREYFDLTAAVPFQFKEKYKLTLNILKSISSSKVELPVISGGKIVKSDGTVAFFLLCNLIKASANFVSSHPSISNYFPPSFKSIPFKSSNFLMLDSLVEENDDILDRVKIQSAGGFENLSMAAKRTLFHYRTWKWAHDGSLREKLSWSRP